jgi:glycerol uptake facilitator-like aquaporin
VPKSEYPWNTSVRFGAVSAVGILFKPLDEPQTGNTRVALDAIGAGAAQMFSEFVATFGLLCVIWGSARLRSSAVPFAVGAYITEAYWFTASTSFANPAVTLARSASDTFAGIRPADAPGFIVAQLLGAAVATGLFRWLVPCLPKDGASVVVAHSEGRTAYER